MHYPELGDFIGAESCLDLRPDVVVTDTVPNSGAASSQPRRRRRNKAAEKEYPPSIPSLTRTENLPPHMPWVMKKYIMGDGRVVIREETVRRHEYFQAHRSDGRLLLDLVPMDGFAGDGEEEVQENVAVSGEEMDGGDERIGDPNTVDVPPDNYGVVGVNPCGGFPVAVAGLMPPVHI